MKRNPFAYYGKKMLIFLTSVLILSIAVFYISRLAPGDPLMSYYGERTEKMSVAEKEAAEESGLTGLKPLCDGIASLEILTVDGHEKRGKYVPSHLHLNVTYLFEGDPSLPLRCKEDENSGVAWIDVEEIPVRSTEPWFVKRIYSKLTEKAAAL